MSRHLSVRHSLACSGNKGTFLFECETWQVDAMMVIALSSVLPACVLCVCMCVCMWVYVWGM